jgi:hypothetical protein
MKTPDTVRDMLSEYEINVQKHESNGSLVIIDSVQGYQRANFYGVLRLIQLLAIRAQKDSKSGIFSIADMGSFFLSGREKELVNYELSIPKTIVIRLKAFCCYHKNDFSLRLTRDQQRQLTYHHYKTTSSQYSIEIIVITASFYLVQKLYGFHYMLFSDATSQLLETKM